MSPKSQHVIVDHFHEIEPVVTLKLSKKLTFRLSLCLSIIKFAFWVGGFGKTKCKFEFDELDKNEITL